MSITVGLDDLSSQKYMKSLSKRLFPENLKPQILFGNYLCFLPKSNGQPLRHIIKKQMTPVPPTKNRMKLFAKCSAIFYYTYSDNMYM